ncbi:MAG: electron transfer flavoprotein subunit alpha/FixB family protein [Pseudomonadota bacterium]
MERILAMKSFIYMEPSEEGIDAMSKQMASGIRKISAALRGPLVGISIGKQLEGKDSQLGGWVDELIRVDVPPGSESNTEMISKILADIIKENGPALLFVGFTHQGMEVGPAVGWDLGIPVVTDCVGLDWTDGQALFRRPIQGGKLIVCLAVNLERGAVISVQKGAWKEDGPPPLTERTVSITPIPWRHSWAPEKSEVLGISEESLEGVEDITKAEILISVGRGLGDPEHLPLMRELAEKLGGMISCSRPVVDLGWLPAAHQVGISGRTVMPTIYLALGISGQANHLAGMGTSRIIIAVNKDPLAPIFDVAHYGVVDNILEFVPELIEKIKEPQ